MKSRNTSFRPPKIRLILESRSVRCRPDAAEQMIGWNCQHLVTQRGLGRSANAELAHRAEDAEAGHVRPDQEGGHALHAFSAALHECLSEGRDDTGAMSVADP